MVRENPLRILDCKQEKCQRVVRGAPQILDHLCKDCHDHFKNVLEFLEELELPYSLNPYLVRGLDYYTRTVFEFFKDSNPSTTPASPVPKQHSKDALVGGGRYDGLIKLLGGKETPACGGACGVERVVNLIKSKQKGIGKGLEAKIFLAQVGQLPKRKALKLFEEFRRARIKLTASFDKDSLSTQLKIADKLKIPYTLILGQKEALREEIIIREMASGKQKIVPIKRIVREMKKKIKK